MTEPATNVDAMLWRAVIRPLIRAGVEEVLYDSEADAIVERALAASSATVHAVAPVPGLDPLLPVYGERLRVYASVPDAWNATPTCELAVLHATRRLRDHVEVVRRQASSGGHAPALLVHGLPAESRTSAGVPVESQSTALFTEHGWTVLDVPGFAEARLVLPVTGGAVGSQAWSLVEKLQHGRAGAGTSVRARRPRSVGAAAGVDGRVEDLRRQLAAAERDRDTLVARERAARELAAVLRASQEQSRLDLERARGDRAAAFAELERARGDRAAAGEELERAERALQDLDALREERDRLLRERNRERMEVKRLELDHDRLTSERAALNARVEELEDLRRVTGTELHRLADSQSWRLGHSLARLGRMLTFRRPGRTDGLRRAAERLEKREPEA